MPRGGSIAAAALDSAESRPDMADSNEVPPHREDFGTIREVPLGTIVPGPTEESTNLRAEIPADEASTLRLGSDEPHTSPASEAGSTIGGENPGASSASGQIETSLLTSEGSQDVAPGQVLFDRYVVEKLIGVGGMGTVWRVRHQTLNVPRAVKLIRPQIAFDPKTRADFRREATIMADLRHPNAVMVHDARIGSELAYIEMEYLEGESIEKILEPGLPMPLEWVARIVEQLCELLDFVHTKGVIHRDLKPSNLMLLAGFPKGREFLKVLDFGIAKSLNPDSADKIEIHTTTGGARFTPHYASPEQVGGGKDLDARSDLYSVGVILYEFLTGYRPFAEPGLIYQHLCVPAPSFASKNPSLKLPSEVEALVLRCLSKDPKERPASARELGDAFFAAVEETGLAATLESTSKTRHGEKRSSVDHRRKPGTPVRTHRGRWVALVIVGLIAAGLSIPALRAWSRGKEASSIANPGTTTAGGTTASSGTTSKSTLEPRRAALAFGYRADSETKLDGGWPSEIVEELSQRHFLLFAPGIYLPEGFSPEDPKDLVNGWPRVLVRQGRGGGRFIRIEGGTFLMGGLTPNPSSPKDARSDHPPHQVTLRDYYIQETEVTNLQMKSLFDEMAVVRSPAWSLYYDNLKLKPSDRDRLQHRAADFVNRIMAAQYARFAGGRLPTEAEWEYAARSRGKKKLHIWGELEATSELTNINNAESSGNSPIPVAESGRYDKDRTEQGVVDLAGNVREWCFEPFLPYSGRAEVQPPDPELILDPGKEYVVRGSSFSLDADMATTTARSFEVGNQEAADLGFRIILRVPPDMRPKTAPSASD